MKKFTGIFCGGCDWPYCKALEEAEMNTDTLKRTLSRLNEALIREDRPARERDLIRARLRLKIELDRALDCSKGCNDN